MTIAVNLIEDRLPVLVDDRTATMGGSFYYEPLRPYDGLPLKWVYDELLRYPKATLIDVGAHTGCYTLLAKHHPDMTVYAFEPVPLTHEVLQANIALNGLSHKVYDYQAGVSNYNGEGTLHSIKNVGGSGVSLVDGTPAYHKDYDNLPVQVITLDSFCKEFNVAPHCIKVDTEGGEKFVLEGAAETIQRYHPFLMVEYSQENANQYGYASNEVVAMIEAWGYTWRNPEGMDLWCVHKEWENIK